MTEEQLSRIIVNFPGEGIADPTGVFRERVTTGQLVVAGVWMLIMAVFVIVEHLKTKMIPKE